MPAIQRLLMLTTVFGLCGVFPVEAAELVSQQEVRSALRAAASQRSSDIDAVSALLASQSARDAASRLGVDANVIRTALTALSDTELRDLAARAEMLESDPTAGLSRDVEDMVVIFLIVAIVILVLKAVD
ncbi:MAG: PA2779 family protein [Vicinamibacteria bacterium]|nr:PA2779 family protein [Vicinamibacteria bacterium]